MDMPLVNKDKIRIAHVLYDLYVGGAEILLLNLMNGLGFTDYEHHVYFFGSDGPIREKIEAMGIPIYEGKKIDSIKHPFRFFITLYALCKDFSSFLKRNRIQIIQSHLSQPNQLTVTVGKILGIPAFPTIHNTKAFLYNRNSYDFRVSLKKILNNVVFRIADRIISVSNEVKGIILQNFGLKDSKVVVVKNGIIFSNFDENSDIGKEFPGSENKSKILAVGRLTYQKNFEILIRAAANIVNSGFKDLLVLIAGEGEDRLQLEKLIHDLDVGEHVKLLGLRHDVIGLMKSCDLLIMPSRFEGLSIAMIEAMACGLPIIGSDVPGLRDYIIDGKNGRRFPVGDDKTLSRIILQLAQDEGQRQLLSIGAKNSFKAEYDLHQNIKPLDRLFREYATPDE